MYVGATCLSDKNDCFLSATHMLDISAVLTGQCGSNMSFQQLRHACFTHAILAGIIGIGNIRTTNKQATPTVIAE